MIGYLLNVDTGATITLLNEYGEEQPWITTVVPVTTSGNYKFVFIA